MLPPDPVAVAMDWYQSDSVMRETGGDIKSYRTKVLEEALKDPEYLAKAVEAARGRASVPGTVPPVKLPPSLTKAPGSGAPDLSDDDVSDRSLFSHATKGMRR